MSITASSLSLGQSTGNVHPCVERHPMSRNASHSRPIKSLYRKNTDMLSTCHYIPSFSLPENQYVMVSSAVWVVLSTEPLMLSIIALALRPEQTWVNTQTQSKVGPLDPSRRAQHPTSVCMLCTVVARRCCAVACARLDVRKSNLRPGKMQSTLKRITPLYPVPT